MILRLRGDVHEDLDWPINRIPAVAELMQLGAGGVWYRVTNVAWAIRYGEDTEVGYDVAVKLSQVNAPVGMTPKDET